MEILSEREMDGKTLRRWREKQSWSREDLAKWLGVSVRSVVEWERGAEKGRKVPGPVARCIGMQQQKDRHATRKEKDASDGTSFQEALGAVLFVARRQGVRDHILEEVLNAGLQCRNERIRSILWWGWVARREGNAKGVEPHDERGVEVFMKARDNPKLWAHHPEAWMAQKALWHSRMERGANEGASGLEQLRGWGARRLILAHRPVWDSAVDDALCVSHGGER